MKFKEKSTTLLWINRRKIFRRMEIIKEGSVSWIKSTFETGRYKIFKYIIDWLIYRYHFYVIRFCQTLVCVHYDLHVRTVDDLRLSGTPVTSLHQTTSRKTTSPVGSHTEWLPVTTM